MRVLSVKQPWADAIVHGPKRVENRTWLTAYRGPIAIHTSLLPDRTAPYFLTGQYGADLRGVIIGTALLVGAHNADSNLCHCDSWGDHAPRVTHLLLGDVRTVEPYPYRGALGLRLLPDGVVEELTGGRP